MLNEIDTLSELIRTAMTDLQIIEGPEYSDRYKIDMDWFHWYDLNNDVCRVCLAGSLIAVEDDSVNYDGNVLITQLPYTSDLLAIDAIRQGRIFDAIRMFYDMPLAENCMQKHENLRRLQIGLQPVNYHEEKLKFYFQLGVIANQLNRVGL